MSAQDSFKYYDEGWNARVRGQPYTSESTLDWQDGWRDMDSAPKEHRTPYPGTESEFNN